MLRWGTILLAACGCLAGIASSASAEVPQATLLPSGRAVAPLSAPPPVEAMIEAANRISHRPYIWGGGGAGRLRHPLGLLAVAPLIHQ